MRESLKEYVVVLGKWLYLLIAGVLMSITGAYLDISGTANFPRWLWILFLVIAFVVASFYVFHKVRNQRNDAQEQKK
jgi:hypothetical protein